MEYDTKLKNWFIVQLINKDNEIDSERLWGIISHDKKRKYPRDCFITTSNIVEKYENKYIKTMNRIYKLKKNSGVIVKLPKTIFTMLALNQRI